MRVLVLAVLAALVTTGCGSGPQEEAGPTAARTTTAPEAPAREPGARPQAPPVEGVSLDGDRLSLAELRGRPVLVNVWSSW